MSLIEPEGSCTIAIPTAIVPPSDLPTTPPDEVESDEPVLKSNSYSKLEPPIEQEPPVVGTFVSRTTVPSTRRGSMFTRSPGDGSAAGLRSTYQPSLVVQSTGLLVIPRWPGETSDSVWATRFAPARRLP